MTGRLLALCAALVLASCDDPPCNDAAAERAAKAYQHCLQTVQAGDGGVKCGSLAYRTFCRPTPQK